MNCCRMLWIGRGIGTVLVRRVCLSNMARFSCSTLLMTAVRNPRSKPKSLMASALLLLVAFRFLLRLDLGLGLHQRPGLAQLPDPLQAINRILGVHHTI